MSPAQFLSKPIRLHLLVLLSFGVVLFGLYSYATIWSYPPGAIHNWRQVDVLSIVDYYHYEHTPLLSPRTYNLFWGDPGVMSEFPGLYWLTARLYDLLGPDESILRIVVSLHFLSLLFAIYLAGWQLFRQPLWAIAPALLLLSTPLLAYYGSNYLPDVPALSWAAWGLFGYVQLRRRKKWGLWLAIIAFTLAGLHKVNALIPLLGILFALTIRLREKRDAKAVKIYLLLFIPLAINVLWYAYAASYQRAHTAYFLMEVSPIWTYSFAEIKTLVANMLMNWGSFYGSKWMFMLLLPMLIYSLIRWRKGWCLETLGALLAFFAYYVLLFPGFTPHDYFMMPLFLVFAMGLWHVGLVVRAKHSFKAYNLLSVAVVLVCALHLWHGKTQLSDGYYKQGREFADPANLDCSFPACLEAKGLSRKTAVISLPDDTPNLTLYLLKSPGWTDFNLSAEELSSSDTRQSLQKAGATYVALHDTTLLRQPSIRVILGDSLGQCGTVHLYRFLE